MVWKVRCSANEYQFIDCIYLYMFFRPFLLYCPNQKPLKKSSMTKLLSSCLPHSIVQRANYRNQHNCPVAHVYIPFPFCSHTLTRLSSFPIEYVAVLVIVGYSTLVLVEPRRQLYKIGRVSKHCRFARPRLSENSTEVLALQQRQQSTIVGRSI